MLLRAILPIPSSGFYWPTIKLPVSPLEVCGEVPMPLLLSNQELDDAVRLLLYRFPDIHLSRLISV